MKYKYYSFLALTIFVLISSYLGTNIVYDYYTYEHNTLTIPTYFRLNTITVSLGVFFIIITAVIAWLLNFHSNTLDEINHPISLDQKYTNSQWNPENTDNYVTNSSIKENLVELETAFDHIIDNEKLDKNKQLNQCFYLLNKNIGSFAGIFYQIKEVNKQKKLVWSSQYMIAIPKNPLSFNLGEGFIGEVAEQGEYKQIRDIPLDKLNLKSALGESKPVSIVLFPIIDEHQIIGVLENAFFDIVSEQKINKIQNAIIAFKQVIKKIYPEISQPIVLNE